MTVKRLPPGPHLDLLIEALDADAGAQRALLAGDAGTARHMFEAAARRYRASYELAPPASHGRLIGMLKAAVLAGDADGAVDAADYAIRALDGADPSPAAGYAGAIAGLVRGDETLVTRSVELMRLGDGAFNRAADAIAAMLAGAPGAYADAIRAIVADFEARDEHLTGVRIADTAVMLEALAEARGIACHPGSALIPKETADS